MDCVDCIKSLWPDDPRRKWGRFNRSECDYCDKPEIERELEEKMELLKEVKIQPEWIKKQWDKVQQLESEILHYRKEYANLMNKLDKLTKQKTEDNAPF